MTKIISKILTTLLVLIAMNSCILGTIIGNGRIVSTERTVNNFYEVDTDFVGDVNIKQGSVQEVRVTGDSNILEYITTTVKQGVLTINSTMNYSSARGISVDITVPDINSVYVNGVGDVDIEEFYTDRLTLITDGVGSIKASGQVVTLTAEVHGVGDLELKNLLSSDATALVDGVGDIEIHANRTLDLRVDGVGDITYYGNAHVTLRDEGVGSIRKGD